MSEKKYSVSSVAVLAVMTSTGLSYGDAAEALWRAIEVAERELYLKESVPLAGKGMVPRNGN